MNKPTRHRYQDIVFEHLAPVGPDAGRWVILCDGLPAMPQRQALMTALAEAGWHAILPRYAGTWESAGNFLAASPTKDVAAIIEAAATGELVPGQTAASSIALLGTSFGGAVAVALAGHPAVSRTVALSPVPSFAAITDTLSTLPAYLHEVFPGAYRFDDADWGRLMRDQLITAVYPSAFMKTAIVAGIEDEQIPVRLVADFAMCHAHFFLAWPGRGHLGFSQVTDELLEAVLSLLDSAEASDEWSHRHLAELFGAETINLDVQ